MGPDCRKPDATQQCRGSTRVVYCSQRCQRAHWGPGGHKKYSGAAAASSGSARRGAMQG